MNKQGNKSGNNTTANLDSNFLSFFRIPHSFYHFQTVTNGSPDLPSDLLRIDKSSDKYPALGSLGAEILDINKMVGRGFQSCKVLCVAACVTYGRVIYAGFGGRGGP